MLAKYTIIVFMFFSANLILSQNLLDSSTWLIGSGSAPGFGVNGSSSENSRELGFNHIGEEVLLWKASPDGSNNADGGFVTSWLNIDRTNTYRFSVWIKKTNSNDGTTYFGCNKSNGDQLLRLNNNLDSNPYFWSGDLPILNRWYLLVGYVHNESYSSNVHLGKIYDGITGEPVIDMIDFKFNNTATTMRQRAFLYYDPNVLDNQYFYSPRIEAINGNEWSLDELLSINPNSMLVFAFDNSGNQKQLQYCSDTFCFFETPPEGKVAKDDLIDILNKHEETVKDDDLQGEEVVIFPNPTTGNVSIKLKSTPNVSFSQDISFYNSAGFLIFKVPSRSKNEQLIDLSNLSSGVYLIHIHLSNGEIVTKQIIKK